MLIGEGKIMVERVIARPFHGSAGAYERENENRHDYGITPRLRPTWTSYRAPATRSSR
jgi:phosphopentomutase